MGGSGGRRGDVERWSQLHDDLAGRLAVVRAGSAGRPVVLYGHSLGGLIVAGYLLTDRPAPDLAVLTSPALDSDAAGLEEATRPDRRARRPDAGHPDRHRRLDPVARPVGRGVKAVDDPRCVKVTTTRFAAEAGDEQERVRALASGGFGIPTLVLHGEDDHLVPVSASARLRGAPLVERRTYPGLRHELHNEPEGAAIIDEVIAWLRGQAIGAPVGRADPMPMPIEDVLRRPSAESPAAR